MCSIRITATPRAFMSSRMARTSSTSDGESPASASSATSSLGCEAIARASSSLRMSTWVSSRESRPAFASSPTCRRMDSASSVSRPRLRCKSGCARAAYRSGMRRLSSTLMLANGRGIWKLRAMPRRMRRCGGRVARSRPSNWIDPPPRSVPAMQFTSVLLPEPFGPMSPTRSPAPTERSTPSSATKPPNRLVTPVATSSVPLTWAPRGGSAGESNP